MKQSKLLKIANYSMLLTFFSFLLACVLSYGFEASLPLFLVAILHVSQMILAGFFKVSYVLRLVAQKQMGQAVR